MKIMMTIMMTFRGRAQYPNPGQLHIFLNNFFNFAI